jgi:hypothetical protein
LEALTFEDIERLQSRSVGADALNNSDCFTIPIYAGNQSSYIVGIEIETDLEQQIHVSLLLQAP